MIITPNDFKYGLLIRFKGDIYEIIEYQRVKIAQRRAFVRTKMRNINSLSVIEESLDSGEKIEEVEVERRKCQFLYHDEISFHFMEMEHYEQFALPKEILGDKALYLIDNLELDVLYLDGKPFTVELPNFINLKIVETEPNFRGDTAASSSKPAKLETGLVVSVPFFVANGDIIRIDTRTNTYIERVAKQPSTY
ncbi:MAG: elongation factor P [bacterium]|nr:elongation factor P [candidate division WOR-3 bacterium]MDH5682990.1 elongation factor P [candidate division WOR-3 bacterium]